MTTRSVLESLEAFLFACLIFVLVLTAFIFFFVFCISWEDWFFGTKLDGLPAGIYLFAKMAAAVAIVYLMAHYPRWSRQSVLVVFVYYGFLCFDSLVTVRKNSQDRDFPVLMAALFTLSVLLLVVHGSLALTGAGEEDPEDNDQ